MNPNLEPTSNGSPMCLAWAPLDGHSLGVRVASLCSSACGVYQVGNKSHCVTRLQTPYCAEVALASASVRSSYPPHNRISHFVGFLTTHFHVGPEMWVTSRDAQGSPLPPIFKMSPNLSFSSLSPVLCLFLTWNMTCWAVILPTL